MNIARIDYGGDRDADDGTVKVGQFASPKPDKVNLHRKQRQLIFSTLIWGFFALISIASTCFIVAEVAIHLSPRTVNFINGIGSVLKYINMHQHTDIPFRLTPLIRPLKYDILLIPDLDAEKFRGEVSIQLEISEKQDLIMLHQKALNISSVDLIANIRKSKMPLEIETSYVVEEKEVFVIKPKRVLDVGFYDLHLTFCGSLSDKIVGFYSSKYKNQLNETRTIATSKFEPTYARRAFPCFDQPEFKAQFSIKLIHPRENCYSALSNMNVKSIDVGKPSEELTTVTFADSVPMSTYLVCFIVSDFVGVTKNAHGLNGKTFPISVYTTKQQKAKAAFALDVGVKTIEYYINLFGIDYPLPKLDMAAIPDFVSGAMENWGMVTYRESRLLYDEKTTSIANKQDIIHVIAHEFAHMWFGNLVTMAWWSDLWLNEGFATYVEFKAADKLFPESNFLDHFLFDKLNPALVMDSKANSHPIIQTVNNPDEINAIFDQISYLKGASLLRMMEGFIGENNFYEGITKYLRKYAYKNAETSDLFAELDKTSDNDINVKNIMDTWTLQMGYPVVFAKQSDKNTYILTQKRFLVGSDPKKTQSPFDYKWTIPITYVTNKQSTPVLVWFDKDAPYLEIKIDEPIDWIKFNVDQVGFYRVNYDQGQWKKLIDTLQWSHKRLSSRDRAHLLEDIFSLADVGEVEWSSAMNMTLYLGREKNLVPWKISATKLSKINRLLYADAKHFSTLEKYQDYVRELVDGIYHEVSWNVDAGDTAEFLNLRVVVLGLACAVGHKECKEDVGAMFKAWINDEEDVRPHPDIRSLVYYYGMKYAGGEKEWNVMFDRFAKETDAAEKAKLMNGLSAVQSSYILKKFIALSTDEKYVRTQDFLGCLTSISNNPEGESLIWDWVRTNWQFLVKRYTLNDRYLGQLIPAVTKSFASFERAKEMEAFFEQYPEAGAGKQYRGQAMDTVLANIDWVARSVSDIDQWLSSKPKLLVTS
ncbi:hypothetical protein TKK_0006740 [Trichogramma kaykai]|uniref:Aminopeptidase n=1 Tax=Trichogramma kaykai TaxID=54128 RepID=A0ABD2XDK6_9HYME